MAKRKYTHRKDRDMPVEHDSIMDVADHLASPELGPYKTRRKNYDVFE